MFKAEQGERLRSRISSRRLTVVADTSVHCDERCSWALNIVSEFTRKCVWIEVDTSESGQRVARVLEACQVYGRPASLLMDKGP